MVLAAAFTVPNFIVLFTLKPFDRLRIQLRIRKTCSESQTTVHHKIKDSGTAKGLSARERLEQQMSDHLSNNRNDHHKTHRFQRQPRDPSASCL
jgi:hypothetical protein